jgi:hypothetical protein
MSLIPQFLGMREAHDEHRKRFGDRTVMGTTWSDCDACLAIAAWDQLREQLRNCRQGKTVVKRQRDTALRGGHVG